MSEPSTAAGEPGKPESGERASGDDPVQTGSPTTGASFRPVGFVERVGAALVAPRSALAEADEPTSAGTAGSDVALLIGLMFLVTRTREIAIALWVGAAESAGAGLQALAGALSQAIAWDLVLLFVAGFALTIAAGGKRAMGRDFDLACVAFVPLIVVRLVGELFFVILEFPLPEPGHEIIAWIAYGWSAFVLFTAWLCARARTDVGADARSATGGRR